MHILWVQRQRRKCTVSRRLLTVRLWVCAGGSAQLTNSHLQFPPNLQRARATYSHEPCRAECNVKGKETPFSKRYACPDFMQSHSEIDCLLKHQCGTELNSGLPTAECQQSDVAARQNRILHILLISGGFSNAHKLTNQIHGTCGVVGIAWIWLDSLISCFKCTDSWESNLKWLKYLYIPSVNSCFFKTDTLPPEYSLSSHHEYHLTISSYSQFGSLPWRLV